MTPVKVIIKNPEDNKSKIDTFKKNCNALVKFAKIDMVKLKKQDQNQFAPRPRAKQKSAIQNNQTIKLANQ